MPTLVVIDDEPNVLYSMEKSLRSNALSVLSAGSGVAGLELVRQRGPDAVVLDVRLGDMSGLDVFDSIREFNPDLPVIIVTAHASTETAIEAMKRGAFEYLLKPVDFHQLRDVVTRAIEQGARRASSGASAAECDAGTDLIVGRSPAMQEVYKAIGRVAPQDVTVLITGESGTGKELVARSVHQHSRRAHGPFLAINCAAIPEALLESELFGHERGAFTGADRRRVGKFEQADGGTIFLDEIGDMSPVTQAKVLRLLQEQKFERLGANETVAASVRVIAATNQNLDALVAAGRFREDLLYRLKVLTITLPPLRERVGDLPMLVEHFIKVFGPSLRKRVRRAAAETLDLLARHRWPGNVRELQSVIKSALVHAPGDVLTPDCLPGALRATPGEPRPEPVSIPDGTGLDLEGLIAGLLWAGEDDLYRKVVLAMDRVVLNAVLNHVKGNQVQASELLGISRTTLRAKLKALGLAVEKLCLSESGRPDQ